MDVCLLDLRVGAVFWVFVNGICVAISLGRLVLNAEVYVQSTNFIMSYHLNSLLLLTIEVAFGKLEAIKFVTPVYQDPTGLNLLAEENWKKIIKINYTSTPI